MNKATKNLVQANLAGFKILQAIGDKKLLTPCFGLVEGNLRKSCTRSRTPTAMYSNPFGTLTFNNYVEADFVNSSQTL